MHVEHVCTICYKKSAICKNALPRIAQEIAKPAIRLRIKAVAATDLHFDMHLTTFTALSRYDLRLDLLFYDAFY